MMSKIIWLLILSLLPLAVFADESLATIELGKSIFEQGKGRDGREIINSTLAQFGVNSSVACAGCHGADGRGGGESFVVAPDIRWLQLSKPFADRRVGTQSVSYTRSSFKKTLSQGITAQGRNLDPLMPRMQLADDEIDSLIAYLTQLSHGKKSQAEIKIVGLLPTEGQHNMADELANRIQQCSLTAKTQRVAALEMLRFATPAAAMAALENAATDNENLLVIAPYILGWEAEYAQLQERLGFTTALPIALMSVASDIDWYYRLPDIKIQLDVLISNARLLGKKHLIIHYNPDSNLSTALLSLALQQADDNELEVVSFAKAKQNSRESNAELWLTPVPQQRLQQTGPPVTLSLVPAMFYSHRMNAAAYDTGSFANATIPPVEVKIAYPYAPLANDVWPSPAQVWGDAVCALLSQLNMKNTLKQQIEGIKLETSVLKGWPARPEVDALRGIVYVDSFEKL